jgi:hypothetical protein
MTIAENDGPDAEEKHPRRQIGPCRQRGFRRAFGGILRFLDLPLGEPFLEFRILVEFHSDARLDQGCDDHSKDRRRDADHEDLRQADPLRPENGDHRGGSGRNGARRDGLLRSDRRDGDRPFGPDSPLHRDLVDDRQERIKDVSRAGQEREEIGDEWRDDRHIPRTLADEAGGDSHQKIDAPRRLHRRRGHDHGQDDEEHFTGNAAGLLVEAEDENGQADAAPEPHADAAGAGAERDGGKEDDQLQRQSHPPLP